jgi:uncharacterized protein
VKEIYHAINPPSAQRYEPHAMRLAIFFALTFAWSWSCWLLAPVVRADSSFAATTLFFFGGCGPSIAAVIVVSVTSCIAGLRAWLARCLRWRVSWGSGWLVLALLSPLAVLTIAAAVHMVLGGVVPPSPANGHLLMLLANFLLVFFVGGPLGEEFGWRGYALPAMQSRFGWRSASLALGGIWGVWHLPLFLIDGSTQAQSSLLAFFILIVATSVFYAWLYNRTADSVLPVLLLHTASNSWPFLIPILPTNPDQRPYFLVVGVVTMAALWLLLRGERNAASEGQPS